MESTKDLIRELAERKGHDFTDWQNNPIKKCNFCSCELSSAKAMKQCDISGRLKDAPTKEFREALEFFCLEIGRSGHITKLYKIFQRKSE